MEKFIDKIGTKYVVQKIKETVRVMPCDNLEELQVSQMACVPDINYQDEYLTLSALEDGTITITIPSQVNSTYATSLSYSKDKSSWVETIVDDTDQTIVIPVSAGDDVYLKGKAKQWGGGVYFGTSIKCSCNTIAKGNIMSLLYGDDFKYETTFPADSQWSFSYLFSGNLGLKSVEDLILPATTLATGCYRSMFHNCPALTQVPELPATKLAVRCYNFMFQDCGALTTAPELPATTLATYCYTNMLGGCSSLVTAPSLPATTLTPNCYRGMFAGCKSLKTAPALNATTLAGYCYQDMFRDCTALETAPALPATTLASSCYYQMFLNCNKLNNITMLATDISATDCLTNWVNGVSSTGTFTKSPEMTSLPDGVSGIPSGWTVIDK